MFSLYYSVLTIHVAYMFFITEEKEKNHLFQIYAKEIVVI